jgi:hypothetical protein
MEVWSADGESEWDKSLTPTRAARSTTLIAFERRHFGAGSMRIAIAFFLLTLSNSVCPAFAETWATLKGRFVYEGELPKRKIVNIRESTKSTFGIPSDFRLTDDRLLVDEKSRGIANILVYAAPERSGSKTAMPVFPSLKSASLPEHVLTLENLVLTPRISYMQTSQSVVFVNPYSIWMIFSYQAPSERAVRIRVNAGRRVSHTISKPTTSPAEFPHGVGAGSGGWLLVRDNPYVTMTNAEGQFEFKNLPVGAWQFVAWHEKAQEELTVNIAGKEEKWSQGEFLATIVKAGTDLGEIVLNEKNFK